MIGITKQKNLDITYESYVDAYEVMSEENKNRYINYIMQKILDNFESNNIEKNDIHNLVLSGYIPYNFQKNTDTKFAINNIDLFLRIKNLLEELGFQTSIIQQDSIFHISILKN